MLTSELIATLMEYAETQVYFQDPDGTLWPVEDVRTAMVTNSVSPRVATDNDRASNCVEVVVLDAED